MTTPMPIRRVAVFNDTRAAGHYGCEIVMQQLVSGLQAQHVEPVWFHPVRSDWRESTDTIPRKPHIDAIVVNGEGSIHHSSTRPRAVYLSQLATFARDTLGVPAYLVNASIDSIDPGTATLIGRFDRVYVRESASRRELENFGIPSRVVADLTLNLMRAPESLRSGTCATDSVLPDVAKTLRRLAKRESWPYRRMSWPPLEPGQAPPSTAAFLDWLGSHELAVTGRFHTVTLCLVTGTPFVAVESNTHKISGLVADLLGHTDRLVQADQLAGLSLDRFKRWTPGERARLDTTLADARSATTAMFEEIRRGIDLAAG